MTPEERELRRALGGPRDPEAPAFQAVWGAARRRQAVRARRRRVAGWAASGAAVALAAVLAGSPWSGPRPAPTGLEHELAESLSGWRAPLDFLLAPPSRGLGAPEELPGEAAGRLLAELEADLNQMGETL